MSGSALTVINTPYVQAIGTEATFWEKLMNNNKPLKKYIKMFTFARLCVLYIISLVDLMREYGYRTPDLMMTQHTI